ncbi:MAG: hypothetical protein RLZZ216_1190 [Cyanobacteriota bacterium]|jgi:hypothetical protein
MIRLFFLLLIIIVGRGDLVMATGSAPTRMVSSMGLVYGGRRLVRRLGDLTIGVMFTKGSVSYALNTPSHLDLGQDSGA